MIVEIVIILEIAHGREPAGKQIVFPQRVERDNEGGTSCVISGEIASHSASQGYPQPHTALNRTHLVANVVHLHGLTIPNITLPC